MGALIPCGLTEVLPGDTFQQATSALIRTTPLASPVMHPTHAKIHHWFVPHRLVWDDWEKFITGGEDGMDASVFPTISTTTPGWTIGSLADYLGLPTERPTSAISWTASALPFRGYALIFNEWYRDQDLQTKLAISKASGPDTTTSTVLQNVAWEKDYFTTARPWTQKGPEITVPLGLRAPVKGIGKDTEVYAQGPDQVWQAGTNGQVTFTNAANIDPSLANNRIRIEQGLSPDGNDIVPNIYADLQEATGATINELRLAFALQRYEENRARHGSRYTEYLALLGIRSSDARLQRPEYLGGGKQTIQYSEVLQTSPTTDGDDEIGVGNLKGHGIGALRSNRYRRYFEEHGYVFSFISVKPTTMYMNNIQRHWNRRTKEDFFQKELQHIGQQELLNKELYVPTNVAEGYLNEVWGYNDRYDEYRRCESSIHGEFRTTLDYWHMARKFSSTSTTPPLNGTFVKSDPTERVFAEEISHTMQMMVNHSIQARRIVASSGTSFIL